MNIPLSISLSSSLLDHLSDVYHLCSNSKCHSCNTIQGPLPQVRTVPEYGFHLQSKPLKHGFVVKTLNLLRWATINSATLVSYRQTHMLQNRGGEQWWISMVSWRRDWWRNMQTHVQVRLPLLDSEWDLGWSMVDKVKKMQLIHVTACYKFLSLSSRECL